MGRHPERHAGYAETRKEARVQAELPHAFCSGIRLGVSRVLARLENVPLTYYVQLYGNLGVRAGFTFNWLHQRRLRRAVLVLHCYRHVLFEYRGKLSRDGVYGTYVW